MSKTKSSKKQATNNKREYIKRDWKQLELDFYKGDCKSVKEFLRLKGIKENGGTKVRTKGWKEKKYQNSTKIVAKSTEKFIEKQSEENANILVKSSDVAQLLLNKIMQQISSESYIHSKSMTEYANATAKCSAIIKGNDEDSLSVTKSSSIRSGLSSLGIVEEVDND